MKESGRCPGIQEKKNNVCNERREEESEKK
jgi:hypothetical protein